MFAAQIALIGTAGVAGKSGRFSRRSGEEQKLATRTVPRTHCVYVSMERPNGADASRGMCRGLANCSEKESARNLADAKRT